ncbi:hypothetical protein EMCRGX_G010705 [Ephydatia muelleri]
MLTGHATADMRKLTFLYFQTLFCILILFNGFFQWIFQCAVSIAVNDLLHQLKINFHTYILNFKTNREG